ncbi:aspartate--tRNA(Asn) ligase [Virgisporangium aurantiacum]|nr:aspartate--tRNA(Asn) ligase [Virgisporangium aurantiacum]
MPQRVLSSELPAHVGETVLLRGWVHRRRSLKSVSFLIVRDRAGLAQVVMPEPVETPEESAVAVVGTVVANPAAPAGVEVVKPTVDALAAAETPPFELFRPDLAAGLSTRLDAAPLAFRHPGTRTALETAAAATRGFRTALEKSGFTEIFTPKLVATATESGANVFPVDYFGRTAYLAQSPQFYKQLMVGVFERVFEVGPVFRAEPHDTGRHLAQYTSLDAELGFIEDHRDVMAVVREAIAGMVEAAAPGLDVPIDIPDIHFPDALRVAGARPDEPDLSPADERALGEWARREHGSDFLFVTGYPMVKRPFYTHPDPADARWSNSFDLLFRGVELVTGGQRLHRHGDYLAALAARGQPVEPYRSYVDAFRYGIPPHGGFAIGLERFVARLLGLANVREATAFPRDRTRLEP